VLRNQGVHKERVAANRPDAIIKNTKEETYVLTRVNTSRKKCHAKGGRKEKKNTRVYVWRHNKCGI
jgi:hypothetical protein